MESWEKLEKWSGIADRLEKLEAEQIRLTKEYQLWLRNYHANHHLFTFEKFSKFDEFYQNFMDQIDAEYQHISGDHILGDFTVEMES